MKIVFWILTIWILSVTLFYVFIFLWIVNESNKYERWINRIEYLNKDELIIELIKEKDECIRYEIMKKLEIITDKENILAKQYCSVYNK